MVYNKNLGRDVENYICKKFGGESVNWKGYFDFETDKALYEVKSCNLINRCSNGNSSRSFKKSQHKYCQTVQYGRFWINNENHDLLRKEAERTNRASKYIFVVVIGKKKVWKTIHSKRVSKLLDKTQKYTLIPISKIFSEYKLGGDKDV